MTSQEIANELQGKLYSDGNVDYIHLIEGVDFIAKFSNVILTILITLLVVSIQLIIGFEIIYINFPLFSDKIDDIMEQGNRKAKFCSLTLRDARKAVKTSVINGTNPNLEYLKLKVGVIFITVFIIAVAVGGGSWFINLVKKLLSGPLELISRVLL
ncbi:MAG: hypothetical protein J6A59_11175 [Lachnospiraceae bacterium]|nr:hypothetical protein [Lachnospiraceae bacterium]